MSLIIWPSKFSPTPTPGPWRNRPWQARTSTLSTLHDHTQDTPHSVGLSKRVIIQMQKPLPDSIHKTQTSMPLAEIGTRSLSKWAAVDLRLFRRHGSRDRLLTLIYGQMHSGCWMFLYKLVSYSSWWKKHTNLAQPATFIGVLAVLLPHSNSKMSLSKPLQHYRITSSTYT